jgi:hypothetical protein
VHPLNGGKTAIRRGVTNAEPTLIADEFVTLDAELKKIFGIWERP